MRPIVPSFVAAFAASVVAVGGSTPQPATPPSNEAQAVHQERIDQLLAERETGPSRIISAFDALIANLPAYTAPTSFEHLEAVVREADAADHVEASVAGTSVEGRPLHLLRFAHPEVTDPWRIFIHAMQHGDEPAGKEAVLILAEKLAQNPDLLPKDVELWLLPCVNPDGAVQNKRRNATNQDLNRDHIALSQPETRALHALHRRLRPHVHVDCHEFGRDSADYRAQGWVEWPLIMMDCASHPLFHRGVQLIGERWVERMRGPAERAGVAYTRYFVGDVPPQGETRFSHPEIEDARNGLGAYHGLSFIIESGFYRTAENPQADLRERVRAYLLLLNEFIQNDDQRQEERLVIERARATQSLPPFLPINYFWASNGLSVRDMKVVSIATSETLTVQTGSFMDTLVVKTTTPSPEGYLIDAAVAPLFSQWLQEHGIPFETLAEGGSLLLERITYLRREDEEDVLYGRYEKRTITQREKPTIEQVAAGSLMVPLTGPDAIRAAILLEPGMLYGLGQYDRFALVPGGPYPISRVVKP